MRDRKLNAAQRAELDRIIDHCERLVNRRGEIDGSTGVGRFETGPWQIAMKLPVPGEQYHLTVRRDGRPLLWVRWTVGGDEPGEVTWRPGEWRQELLRVPAAHA